MWGTLQFFYSLAVAGTNLAASLRWCKWDTIFLVSFRWRSLASIIDARVGAPIHHQIRTYLYRFFYVLFNDIIIIQAIGDGGQGWGNAVLFIMFSKSIHERLFINPMKRLCGYIQKKWVQERPALQSGLLKTAPSSHPASYPSSTYFVIPHSNHSDFTSVRDRLTDLVLEAEPQQGHKCNCLHCCTVAPHDWQH